MWPCIDTVAQRARRLWAGPTFALLQRTGIGRYKMAIRGSALTAHMAINMPRRTLTPALFRLERASPRCCH